MDKDGSCHAKSYAFETRLPCLVLLPAFTFFGDSKFPLNISTSHLIVLPIVPESCCLHGKIGSIKFTNVVLVTFP